MSAAQMQSLSEISGALDAGNVTSEALVQAHLARIADLSDGLNCFVEVEADRALSAPGRWMPNAAQAISGGPCTAFRSLTRTCFMMQAVFRNTDHP